MNGGSPLALVELLDRDGRVVQAVPVWQWPLHIGRALDNGLVLDDPHVAARHASLAPGDDLAPALHVHPGLNGVLVGRRRLAGGETLALGGPEAAARSFGIGLQRLRVRLADDPLPPERALHAAPRQGGTALLALVLWAWVVTGQLLQLDPGARLVEWLAPALGLPAALAAWCLAWALVSKLFQHRFDFWPHAAVAVRYLALAEALEFGCTWIAAITSFEWLSRVAPTLAAAVLVAMLVAHALLVLPHHGRALRVFAGVAFVVGAGVLAMQNLQRHDRLTAELYMTTLPPPPLLLARPLPAAQFLQAAGDLRRRLDARVAEGDDDSEPPADE